MGKGGSVFRNKYKGQSQKGVGSRVGGGDGWGGVGGKWRQLYLNSNKKKREGGKNNF